MGVLPGVVAIVGIVAQALAWRRVARGGDVWRTMPPLFLVLGTASLLLLPSIVGREPAASHAVSTPLQLWLGVLSGIGLFAGTRIFVVLVRRSSLLFARDTRDAYRRAEAISTALAVVLAAFVVAVGEELFWRGLVYGVGVQQGLTIAFAGFTSWLLYVAANRSSRLRPILAAAIVGGALWTGLAWWTGGILASIVSHMLWTGLMLGFPPGPARAEIT
jgi:membrane protease YdiL (CAAX protease family)